MVDSAGRPRLFYPPDAGQITWGEERSSPLPLTLVFGIEKEPAAVMAIMVWLISFASCCLAGAPLLFCEGWSAGELRRTARAEERAGAAALLAEAEHAASSGK